MTRQPRGNEAASLSCGLQWSCSYGRSTASRRAKAKIARAKAKAKMVKANRREMAKARVMAKIPGNSLGSERMVRAMAAKRTTKEARRERIAAKASRTGSGVSHVWTSWTLRS